MQRLSARTISLGVASTAIALVIARNASAQSTPPPWGGASSPPVRTAPAVVPVVIRSERGSDTVQFGSATLWLDAYGTPFDPLHDVCRTPCTLYVRPGRVPLSFAGLDGGTNHDIDVAPNGSRVTLRESPLLRTGMGLAISGVLLTAASLATLFASEPDCAGTGAQVACGFEEAGIAGLAIASSSLVVGLVTMVIGRNQRVRVEPLQIRF